ncbi:MAG: hypothetical protein ACK4PR_04795 [Gammaproteobacteria bacterium]
MVNNENITTSHDQADAELFKDTLSNTSHGVAQAIYELAKAYLTVKNFPEAIEWSSALAENPGLASPALELLAQVRDQSTDAAIIAKAENIIAEIMVREQQAAFKEKEKLLLEVEG